MTKYYIVTQADISDNGHFMEPTGSRTMMGTPNSTSTRKKPVNVWQKMWPKCARTAKSLPSMTKPKSTSILGKKSTNM